MVSRGSEVKVAVFIMVLIAAVVGVILWLGGQGLSWHYYRIYVTFEDAEGLQEGSNVLLAGVRVGRVGKVGIKADKPRVELWIERRYPLKDSYEFKVTGASPLLADRYIEITPMPGGKILTTGEVVEGKNGLSWEDFIGRFQELTKISDAAVDFILNVNRLVGKYEGVGGSIQRALSELSSASRSVAGLVSELRGTVKESRPQLSKVFKNLTATAISLSRAAEAANSLLSNKTISEDIKSTIAAIKRASEQIEATATGLNKFWQEQDIGTKLGKLTQDASEALKTIKESASKVDTLMAEGYDSLKRVEILTAKGAEFLDRGTETMQKVSGAIEKAETLMEESHIAIKDISKSIGGTTEVLQRGGKVIKGLEKIEVKPKLDIRFSPEIDKLTSELNLRVFYPQQAKPLYLFGLYDLGPENKLNLQAIMEPSSLWGIRYGFIRSRLGFGLDLMLYPKANLSFDLYDPNEPQLNIYGYYDLGNNWSVGLGLEGANKEGYFTLNLRYLP